MRKILTVFLFIGIFFILASSSQIFAAATNCNPNPYSASFFSDSQLQNRISTVFYSPPRNNSTVLINDLYIVFACSDEAGTSATIQSDQGVLSSDFREIESSSISVSGNNFLVGHLSQGDIKVLLARTGNPNLKFRATKNSVAFAEVVSIPVQQLDSSCVIAAQACREDSDPSKYKLSFALTYQNMGSPGLGAFSIKEERGLCIGCTFPVITLPSPSGSIQYEWYDLTSLSSGSHTYCLTTQTGEVTTCSRAYCKTTILVGAGAPLCSTTNQFPEPPGTKGPQIYEICTQIPTAPEQQKCTECTNKQGIWTAIGCIKTDFGSIAQQVLKIGLGIGGGFALLLILFAGFTLSTSQGDPKRTSEAKELITSVVIGLLFIIFSVTILQFIGVNLFRLPGFGG